jgi:hypothetical protein
MRLPPHSSSSFTPSALRRRLEAEGESKTQLARWRLTLSRPWACLVCRRTFSRQEALRQHCFSRATSELDGGPHHVACAEVFEARRARRVDRLATALAGGDADWASLHARFFDMDEAARRLYTEGLFEDLARAPLLRRPAPL